MDKESKYFVVNIAEYLRVCFIILQVKGNYITLDIDVSELSMNILLGLVNS